jgi:DNA invertase Pin-like site-specific DNA recombinase
MIAAIYARKSTDQNIADEEKSVARQVARARAYAERKGWAIDDAHIYVDDGISGADFVRRDGYLRLMNALKPRPPFQALVMMEQSRLGREQTETTYAINGWPTPACGSFSISPITSSSAGPRSTSS